MIRAFVGVQSGLITLALLGGVGCAHLGPELVSEPQLISEFEVLHERIYQVYGLGSDRDAIHSLLASCFVGEQLTLAYVEQFTSAVRMQEKQTDIEISAVEHTAMSILGWIGRSPRIDVTWTVTGQVSHQGHQHTRINRYRAIYELTRTEQGWRISDVWTRDLERLPVFAASGVRTQQQTPLELLSQQPPDPAPAALP